MSAVRDAPGRTAPGSRRASRHRRFGALTLLTFVVACTPGVEPGMLEVRLDPPLGAEVVIDGPELDEPIVEPAGTTARGLPPGRYDVCFSDVPGYLTPDCDTVQVRAGETAVSVGEYVLDPEPPLDAAPDVRPGPEPDPDLEVWQTPISHGDELTREHVGPRVPLEELEASGPVRSRADGEIIEKLLVEVSGLENVGITVTHDDVVVQDVVVRHRDGANGIQVGEGTRGGQVIFSHLDGRRSQHNGNFGSIGVVGFGEVRVWRSSFEDLRDGVHLYAGSSSVLESIVVSTHNNPGAHNDGLSYRGSDSSGVVFARNRTVSGTAAAGITLFAERGPIKGVAVLDNLIVGTGEGFGLYGGYSHEYRDENAGIRIEGNRFTGEFGHPEVLGEGANTAVNVRQPGNTFVGNRWRGSVIDLPARCGITDDDC